MSQAQMSIAEGIKQNPPLAAGDFWRQSLPPIEFGRIAAQTAKQVISQKVRDAERSRQFEEYKDRIGEIVVGTVKRAESYSITVDLGRAEAVVRREEMIPERICVRVIVFVRTLLMFAKNHVAPNFPVARL